MWFQGGLKKSNWHTSHDYTKSRYHHSRYLKSLENGSCNKLNLSKTSSHIWALSPNPGKHVCQTFYEIILCISMSNSWDKRVLELSRDSTKNVYTYVLSPGPGQVPRGPGGLLASVLLKGTERNPWQRREWSIPRFRKGLLQQSGLQ